MEDVQYHLTGLFRLIKGNFGHLPVEQQKLIESAANAVQKALDTSKVERKGFAQLVQKMRHAQNMFFKFSREKNFQLQSEWLKTSKTLEAQTDKKALEILQGVKQADLFA